MRNDQWLLHWPAIVGARNRSSNDGGRSGSYLSPHHGVCLSHRQPMYNLHAQSRPSFPPSHQSKSASRSLSPPLLFVPRAWSFLTLHVELKLALFFAGLHDIPAGRERPTQPRDSRRICSGPCPYFPLVSRVQINQRAVLLLHIF